jgi:predicted patatin/cPLA2 family phospholipase
MTTGKSDGNADVVLVLGDGAIRAGFVAGVVSRLFELHPDLLSRVAVVYGASASAGNAVYLSSFGDQHPGQRMWTELLGDPLFIKKQPLHSSQPVYDIEYLIETIFRKNTTLPVEAAKTGGNIGIILPALKLGSADVHYFASRTARAHVKEVKSGALEKLEDFDIYRVIGAASAAPFVYDRSFDLGGTRFIDAAAISPSIDDIEFSSKNLKFIYVFCRRPPNIMTVMEYFFTTFAFISFVLPFRKKRLPLRHYVQYAFKPNRMRKAFANAFARERSGKAVVVYPRRDLGDIDDNSAANLERNFAYGGQVAEKIGYSIAALTSL